MHLKALYQINVRNNHVTENISFTMQSTFPGVLPRENCVGVGTIFQA